MCRRYGKSAQRHTDTQAYASSLLGHCQFLAEITQMSLLNFHYCSPFLVQQYVLILNWTTINFTQFDRSFVLARMLILPHGVTVFLFSNSRCHPCCPFVRLLSLRVCLCLCHLCCLCDNFLFTVSTLFERFTHCTRYIRRREHIYILYRWIDWNERALNMVHAIVTLYHWKWEVHSLAPSHRIDMACSHQHTTAIIKKRSK